MVTPDRLWLESVDGLQQGDLITQTRMDAELQTVFAAFEEQWAQLWATHESISSSQWATIVDFATATLQPQDLPPVQFSADNVAWTMRSKKVNAATGLDGVARADILALHPPELDNMVQLFNAVESHGRWPQQALHASVRSLSKVDDPTKVTHFRPITVLSNVYRCWSSISSRHWLSAISGFLDPWLCGNRAGYRAASAWQHVMAQIEQCRNSSTPATGLVLDLIKACNQIPRYPTMVACKLLGIHQNSLVAWAGALGQICRHFIVDGSASRGVTSSRGLPEGCGMSCVGMAALTELFHRWVRALHMPLYAISYVDDWQVLMSDPRHMRRVLNHVDAFIRALDMERDEAKTYVWSSDPLARQSLRSEGFRVVLRSRALGAHVTYTRQLTNGTLLSRIADLSSFWDAMQTFKGTFRQKVRLVLQVAWPRALHASSTVVIGRKHFGYLRTDTCRALRCDKPGVNPALLCALETPSFDPQLYVFFETVRDFRTLDPVNSQLALGCVASSTVKAEWNAFHEIVCQRLHQVGFQVLDTGWVADDIGAFDLTICSLGELQFRVSRLWTQVLASLVHHRAAFVDFAAVDLAATRARYQACSPFDQGVMRRWLSGALLANDVAWRWSALGKPRIASIATA